MPRGSTISRSVKTAKSKPRNRKQPAKSKAASAARGRKVTRASSSARTTPTIGKRSKPNSTNAASNKLSAKKSSSTKSSSSKKTTVSTRSAAMSRARSRNTSRTISNRPTTKARSTTRSKAQTNAINNAHIFKMKGKPSGLVWGGIGVEPTVQSLNMPNGHANGGPNGGMFASASGQSPAASAFAGSSQRTSTKHEAEIAATSKRSAIRRKAIGPVRASRDTTSKGQPRARKSSQPLAPRRSRRVGTRPVRSR